MSIRLALFFIISFLGLNGCLYSCNYAPELKTYNNPDKCDESGKSQLVKFVSVTGANGSLDIKMIMLLPCKGDGTKSDTYSLAFYDADNYIEARDATNVKVDGWGILHGSGAKCGDDDANQETIEKIKKQPDFNAIGEGAAITLGIGAKHSNRIYPYIAKIPMSNIGGVGKGDDCIDNINMSPFIQDTNTLSPIIYKGKPAITETGEVLLALYSKELVQMVAPLFSYGFALAPEGSNSGIHSTPNITTEGSFFDFSVKLKPANYYLVLSKVTDPMAGAMKGDFSLNTVKIFSNNGSNSMLDYEKDCSKKIACGGKASAIRVR